MRDLIDVVVPSAHGEESRLESGKGLVVYIASEDAGDFLRIIGRSMRRAGILLS